MVLICLSGFKAHIQRVSPYGSLNDHPTGRLTSAGDTRRPPYCYADVGKNTNPNKLEPSDPWRWKGPYKDSAVVILNVLISFNGPLMSHRGHRSRLFALPLPGWNALKALKKRYILEKDKITVYGSF